MRMNGLQTLVTGAASGIGRELALTFAREGAGVAVADVNDVGAKAVANEIEELGGRAVPVRMDVTDEVEVERAISATVAELGGLDVLVSNAGVQHIEPLVDLSYDNWQRLLRIHLDGAFLTTRAAMREMIRAGHGGTILYMGSVHSKVASPLKAPYVAAKHGLAGLCKAVAVEGAPHAIRANLICPGFVRTPLVDRQIPEQARELHISEEQVIKNVMLKDTVDGEFTTTGDVAETAVFLATFASSALTGQSVVVSHGWFMQ